MEGDIVLARIYPSPADHRRTTTAIRKSTHLYPITEAHGSRVPDATVTGSRGSKAANSGVELRFSSFTRNDRFIVGSSNQCQLVFKERHIDTEHFQLRFDNLGRLVLQNMGKQNWVDVSYQLSDDRKFDMGIRTKFTFILNGYEHLTGMKFNLRLPGDYCIQIEILPVQVTSEAYMNEVQRKGGLAPSMLTHHIGRLGLMTGTITGSHMVREYVNETRSGNIEECWIELRDYYWGGQGVVRQMWNTQSGAFLARKVLTSLDKANIQAFEAEIKALEDCNHPHIVKLLPNLFQSCPNQFEMEWAAKGSLANAHQDSRLSPHEIRSVIRQVLLALIHIQDDKNKYIHRDLKPDNILVFDRNEQGIYVKLGDFGIAKAGNLTRTTRMWIGKYSAPEFWGAMQTGLDYDHSVDVWGLGVTAYGLLRGLPSPEADPIYPRSGISWCELIVNQFNRDFACSPEDPLMKLISRMLVINPKCRLSAQGCYELELMLDPTRLNISTLGQQPAVGSSQAIPLEEEEDDDDDIITPRASPVRSAPAGRSAKRKMLHPSRDGGNKRQNREAGADSLGGISEEM